MKPVALPSLLSWLYSVTAAVQAPLLASTLCRILTQLLDIALFAVAGWTVAQAITGLILPQAFVVLSLCALARALTHYLEQFSGHYVAFKALELLRGHAFSRLWPQAPALLVQQHSATLLTQLTRDIDRIEVVYAHTFAPLVSAVVVPALALGFGGYMCGWHITLLPLLCLLCSVIVLPVLGLKRSIASSQEVLDSRAQIASQVSDSIYGIREVQTYSLAQQRSQELADRDRTLGTLALVPARVKGLRRALNLFFSLVTVASLVFWAVQDQLSLPWALALILGGSRLFEAPQGIESAAGYLDQSFSAARRLYELCHSNYGVKEGSKNLSLERAPQVRWRSVSYRYPTAAAGDPAALENLNLVAEAGRWTVLMGPSGSGKSTAVQLLLRFDDPSSGEILLDNQPVTSLSLACLRSQVVLLPQDPLALTGSLADNVRLGLPEASDEEVWRALALAELDQEVRAMPHGLQTQLGSGSGQLSGGQLQRLALARALIMQPKVLILDEFTSHLNTDLADKVRHNIWSLCGQMTVIEISHHMQAEKNQRVFVFERGRLRDA